MGIPLRSVFVLLLAAAPTGCDLFDSSGSTGPLPPVRTYRDGTVLYLERRDGGRVMRVGLETAWGGAISEVSLDGANFINAFDAGREVQLAAYDADHEYDECSGCSGVWGWNPVQGGDRHGHGSPVVERRMADSSIYLRIRPLEWVPDNKGGGGGKGVLSDVQLEQTVSVVPEHPSALHVRYRITHLGSDTHAAGGQEVPALFANLHYGRFTYYAGDAPWTGDSLTVVELPTLPGAGLYAPERWAAFTDRTGVGITVFTPTAYPYMVGLTIAGEGGARGYAAGHVHPVMPFGLGPGEVVEADVYLVVGDVRQARETVYALRPRAEAPDVLAPYGDLSAPRRNAVVSSDLLVDGWAFDDTGVRGVEVWVDGALDGMAEYGGPHVALAQFFGRGVHQSAFVYRLDTTRYTNGVHNVRVRVIDTSGNVLSRTVPVSVAN